MSFTARGKDLLSQRWRRRRMHQFIKLLNLKGGERILDLGGNLETWTLSPISFNVTILNTSDIQAVSQRPWRHPRSNINWNVILGDACDLSNFDRHQFDAIYCNSLIEHVGDDSRIHALASHIKRVGKKFWVQTPAYFFPIEAHTGLPFFGLYPKSIRNSIFNRIDQANSTKEWYTPLVQTRFLTLSHLRQEFPAASIYTERVAGLTKSWCLYHAVNEDR